MWGKRDCLPINDYLHRFDTIDQKPRRVLTFNVFESPVFYLPTLVW